MDHLLPPTIDRVHDSRTRLGQQRCRALSVSNRHSRQVTEPNKWYGRKDRRRVSFRLCNSFFSFPHPLVPGFNLTFFQLCALSVVPPVFHPEYGRFMLESTPGAPYTGSVRDLVLVEFDMRLR